MLTRIKDMSDIDPTKEGILLKAAIAILATNENIILAGEQLNGCLLTPSEIIHKLNTLVDLIHGTSLPPNNYESVSFEDSLQIIINRYSMEQDSNTPDYILARYLKKCLDNYNETVIERNKSASILKQDLNINYDTNTV